MKEDYLWDRTGDDAVIEDLEQRLGIFRYAGAEPPELPAKLLKVHSGPKFVFFPLRLAFGAALTFAVLAAVVWVSLPESDSELAAHLPRRSPDVVSSAPLEAPAITRAEAGPEVKPSMIKARFAEPARAARSISKVHKSAAKPRPVRLSSEEKYAYDQLMLALSITSSKLNIVKEKIDGIDEQGAASSKEANQK